MLRSIRTYHGDAWWGMHGMESNTFFGPYEVRDELGRGAMACVWRAFDPRLEREVAIKEPLFDPRLSPEVQQELASRFVAEGRTAARLNHPGIVTIYEADVWNGRAGIVMELVEGPTLREMLSQGPLKPSLAVSILDQLLDVVEYAHRQGVIHRDIKPDNIFLTPDGVVKLVDFGIARSIDGARTMATSMGTVLGTPGYLSPEQAQGTSVDSRSDLFSIGSVAYEMFSGRNPFGLSEDTAITAVLYRIVYEEPEELPASVCNGLAADPRPAIEAALAKSPDDRPASAADLKAMLHGMMPVPAPAASTPVPPTRSATAHPMPQWEGEASTQPQRSARRPSWLPYALVGVLGVAALVFALVSAMSGATGGGGASSISPPSSSNTTQSSNEQDTAMMTEDEEDESQPEQSEAPEEEATDAGESTDTTEAESIASVPGPSYATEYHDGLMPRVWCLTNYFDCTPQCIHTWMGKNNLWLESYAPHETAVYRSEYGTEFVFDMSLTGPENNAALTTASSGEQSPLAQGMRWSVMRVHFKAGTYEEYFGDTWLDYPINLCELNGTETWRGTVGELGVPTASYMLMDASNPAARGSKGLFTWEAAYDEATGFCTVVLHISASI